MNLTIKDNREITPQKIAVKQYEASTTILKFKRSSYMYDTHDLRNCKAYAITCNNGEIDMTELTQEVNSSGELTLTWKLSARTLLHAGAISYQISFKDENGSVFNTYQAIIQNSASIDETDLVGDYPTIMKQWLDLINARSGTLPNKIVYMQPDSPVPVADRAAGTLYYQWEEAATMGAMAATGIVNLGSSPYADSGLYINGKHVYVDNTNDTVFVLEPSVWVDTINAADCGVIASDATIADEIRILLTAAESGAVGNNITYDLALAQYGAGKGQNNPSGGTTQGATLVGGSDTQDGVENPRGRFEDHFGNILGRLITEEQLNSINMTPDYSKAVEVSTSPYTAPSNGFFTAFGSDNGSVSVSIGAFSKSLSNGAGNTTLALPIAKGDVITFTARSGAWFIPFKQFSF